MLGQTVEVLRRTKTGEDEYNEPLYEWSTETVKNVVVRPLTAQDAQGQPDRVDGVRILYTLAFPKTYTKDLAHCKVRLKDRTREVELVVAGAPDITRPCPTPWDRLVQAGVVEDE